MKGLWKLTILCVAFCIVEHGSYHLALSQQDRHRATKQHGQDCNHFKEQSRRYFDPVNDITYKKECGACHFAYQPGLLPSGSWERILAGINDHFGVEVVLDPASKEVISAYLKSNSAGRSPAKQAARIMKGLGNLTPLRITDIPYIRNMHDDISPSILKRDSGGSLSNCSACHKTADKGIFDDDSVESSD
jgi:hypothetical protein